MNGAADGVEIRLVVADDAPALIAAGARVFDGPVHPGALAGFLAEPSHFMVGAFETGALIGMASAVVYRHPDKPLQLWINEVGVAEDRRRRGVGRALVAAVLAEGAARGCAEAWLGTEGDNAAARALYRAAGGAETEGIVMVAFKLGAPGLRAAPPPD